MIAPMLCFDAKGDLSVIPRDGKWIMEPKLDGWRWQVHILMTEPGKANWVRSYGGRNGSDYTDSTPEIESALQSLPAGTVLDGELIGRRGEDVSTLLANGGTGLMFVAFDVLREGGEDVMAEPWNKRRTRLEYLFRDIISTVTCPSVYEHNVSDEVFQSWLKLGFEGAVCKHEDSTYRPGKRSRDWPKVKPQTVADAEIIGWVQGKGASNKHRAGAVKVRIVPSGVETTVGVDWETEAAEASVGRLIEFKHHGIQASGKPRHPVWHRFREDLEPVRAPVTIPAELKADMPGAWVRNYGSMGDAKLLKVLGELESDSGDATARVRARQGSVAHNAATAREAARLRGLL